LKIIVVDDDRLVALSLKTILESTGGIEVAGIGSSGSEAIELYARHIPDVVLMDIRMDGMTGLEAGEKILAQWSDAKILYLTTFPDDDYIIKSLNIGAKGYILKQNFESIAPALEAVVKGQSVFGEEIINRMSVVKEKPARFDYEAHDICEREKEIIELAAEGKNNKEIALELSLSEGTVRNYISIILEKLNLRDRTQLVVFYYMNIK
jgi:DNA-binding NarL/FixJ family response regulator